MSFARRIHLRCEVARGRDEAREVRGDYKPVLDFRNRLGVTPMTRLKWRVRSHVASRRRPVPSKGLLVVTVPLVLGPTSQCEMSSRASPRVGGPKIPIDRTMISIDAEIRPKTPAVPKFCRKKATRKLVRAVEIRLKE